MTEPFDDGVARRESAKSGDGRPCDRRALLVHARARRITNGPFWSPDSGFIGNWLIMVEVGPHTRDEAVLLTREVARTFFCVRLEWEADAAARPILRGSMPQTGLTAG